jgi:hypothetical protein
MQPGDVIEVLRAAAAARPADVSPAPASTAVAAPGSLSRGLQDAPLLSPQLSDVPPEDLEAMAPPPRRHPKVGIVLPALAAICLTGFVVFTGEAFTKLSTYHQANGKIVELICTRRTTRGDKITAVVEYRAGGNLYQFKDGNVVGMFSRYKVGDTVEVMYTPDRPAEAFVSCFVNRWGAPLAFGIPGFGFLALCLWARRRAGKPMPAARIA